MNYEQKYKEALERAKNLHKDAIDMGENIRAKQCEIIFPELKESEDVRIRKWLIDWAKAVNWSEQFTVTKEQVLAWLEKQGEPLSVDVDVETKDENAQDLIEKYVSDHANCRWLDASELEQLLNDFVLEYDKIKNREYEQQCKCKSK